jgi:amino acid adenylation domain-containing protein
LDLAKTAGALPAHAGPSLPPGAFPLSAAQRGIWYAQHFLPRIPINIALFAEIDGAADVDLLVSAGKAAALEIGSGMVRVVEAAGTPWQVVDPDLSASLQVLDFRSEPDPSAAATAWMHAEYSAPTDILADRLLAGALLRVGEQRHYLYTRAHHIVLDGFGAMTFINRVAQRYTAALAEAPAPKAPMADLKRIVEDEAAYRSSDRFAADRRHWAERLADLPPPLSLAGRTAPPAAHSLLASAEISQGTTARLDAAAAEWHSSSAPILIAAFAIYLARMTGSDDVVLSLPVSARTSVALRRSGGMVSNIVPVRVRVPADGAVGGVVAAAALELTGALRRQRYRHEDIRRDLGLPATELGLFGPSVNIMRFAEEVALGEAAARVRILTTGPVEDLSVNMYGGAGGGSRIDFEANPRLYTQQQLDGHLARYLALLEQILDAGPGAVVGSLGLVADAGHTPLDPRHARAGSCLAGISAEHELPAATLPDLLAAQAQRTPDRPCLQFEDQQLTYRQFGERVNRLARKLVAAGVGPEARVAVAMRRSLDLLAGIYAVLAAGGAYVPLDPDYPRERIRHLLRSAEPAAILTTRRDRGCLPDDAAGAVIEADTAELSAFAATALADSERLAPLRPGHLAYVVYTSGSTGRPKGVGVTHRSAVNQILWMRSEYGISADDVVLQKTPATFDVSVWELFAPLAAGARLVIAAPGGHADPQYVASAIDAHQITLVSFVPAMLAVFCADLAPGACASLRAVLSAGEPLPAAVAARCLRAIPAQLHNLYGPTEFTVHATAGPARGADRVAVPIGTPVWNTRAYVLDRRLQPVPAGAEGELYLAGAQLARGYIGQSGLTAERFVADPFSADPRSAPGARMYRTGDIVRWNGEALEYVGRTDFQVKLRGLRVELGEIERALLSHGSVRQAAVVLRSETSGADAAENQYLAAYVVRAPHSGGDGRDLLDFVSAVLPPYMVPAVVVALPEMPLGPSGKLDRQALPAPARDNARTAPRTEFEAAAAQIFSQVLGVERVGIDESFFALGGNSLTATKLMARISAATGTQLSARTLFEAPTIRALGAAARRQAARRAGTRRPAAQARRPALAARRRPGRIPLSLAQQRIWFANQFDTASAAGIIPFAVRLTGTVDVSAARRALVDVIGRHEPLRTIYPAVDGVAHQQVLDAAQAAPDLVIAPAAPDALAEQMRRIATAGFDIATDPPVRAAILELSATEHVVVLAIHHIAFDGWSFAPFARDFICAYCARAAGAEPDWQPLPVQYADYSLWQRALLGSADDPGSVLSARLRHWRRVLDGLPARLDLPFDRPPAAPRAQRAGSVDFTIDAELAAGLRQLAQAHESTLFMVMHAALAALLSRVSGTDDIAVGTPLAGRGEEALDELVGMFANPVVLRTRVRPDSALAELLAQARDVAITAFENWDVPFELLVETINPARSAEHHPLFQVMLVFQNTETAQAALPGLAVETQPIDAGVTRFDLQFTVFETPHAGPRADGMNGSLTFATDVFDASSAQRLAQRYLAVLRTLAADAQTTVAELDTLELPELDSAWAGRPGRR